MTAPREASKIYPPEWLVSLLRCPITGQRLRRWERGAAEADRADSWTHRDGRSVSDPPSQGLLSEDGRWLYPLSGPVACLVPGEAIELAAVPGKVEDTGG